MKTIKIMAIPSHQTVERTSGVDFARIIQPMQHLDGYCDEDTKFKVHVYHPVKDKTLDWLEVAKKYDIIYFNYTAMPWEFAKMGLMARKFNRLLVLDMDDSLWDIMPDNPAYDVMKKGSEYIRNMTAICNEADYITTTNKYLRNVIAHNTKKEIQKIEVFPNLVDLGKMWSHKAPFKDTGQIRLAHFGSTTHFIDLQNKEFEKGIDMVMKNYPNVVFTTIGAMIGKYKYRWGQRYENRYGHQDVYKWAQDVWPDFADEIDIIVTPLEINRYTMCKSSIKFLEGSSAVKPGVWQRARQYEEVIEDGKNGFLATYAEDWYRSISKLIDDTVLRKLMGEEAYKTVVSDWQMKGKIANYAEFFKSILR